MDHIQVDDGGHLLCGVIPFEFVRGSYPSKIKVDGSMVIGGRVSIATGAMWHVGPNSRVEIGDRTYFSPHTLLRSTTSVTIGRGCAIAWHVQIIDDNAHPIAVDGRPTSQTAPIVVGDDVWVGSRVTLLPGTEIADGCVVAAGSVVNKKFDEPHCLIAGLPARVVRSNVRWSK